MDTVTMIFGGLLKGLVLLGSAVKVILKILPIIFIIFFIYMFYIYHEDMRYRRLIGSRILEIDKLSPVKLCFLIGFILKWLGYREINDNEEDRPREDREKNDRDKSEVRGYSDDVDLLVSKGETRYAVLVEKKENGVGTIILRKLEGAMAKYNCGKGIIINNGHFNKLDQQEAGYGDIELWNRDLLIHHLLSLQGIEDTHGQGIGAYIYNFFRWLWRGG